MAKETEYFVVLADVPELWTAAYLMGSISTRYVSNKTPEKALMSAVNMHYSHIHTLYAAYLYRSADDYHRKAKPILQWQSKVAGAVDDYGHRCGTICEP